MLHTVEAERRRTEALPVASSREKIGCRWSVPSRKPRTPEPRRTTSPHGQLDGSNWKILISAFASLKDTGMQAGWYEARSHEPGHPSRTPSHDMWVIPVKVTRSTNCILATITTRRNSSRVFRPSGRGHLAARKVLHHSRPADRPCAEVAHARIGLQIFIRLSKIGPGRSFQHIPGDQYIERKRISKKWPRRWGQDLFVTPLRRKRVWA